MDRFIADLHLGDKKHSKKRGFNSIEEMHDHIIEEWNLVTSKNDRVFLLGDVAISAKYYPLLEELNGKIYVILGNHDKFKDVPKLLKYVEGISGLYKYVDNIYLSHCPINECQIGSKVSLNIHGHMHKNYIKTYIWDYAIRDEVPVKHPNFINVCVDRIGYNPQTLNQLMANR
jgi:calcineurin-like phosphoesterase family protein